MIFSLADNGLSHHRGWLQRTDPDRGMQRLLTTLLLLLAASTTWGAATATLERAHISTLDNFTLTLEVDARVEQRPDFSPLEENFRLLGSKRTLISSHSSSGRAVRTRWQLTLRPRRSGQLTLPALDLAGDSTPALQLEVTEAGPARIGQPGAIAFFQVLTDQPDVYVDGQLLYTARLFHLDPLSQEVIMDPPRADNSLVRAIGERQEYEGDYRGDPYLITEQQYAIFPSREGPLRIQGPRLQLPLQGEAGPVELQGEPVEIEVLPPAYQSSNGLWLPATRLNLEEAWHPPSQLQVGERIQRTLSLRVTGIPAERLPALMAPKVDGFHVEVEEVELTESTSSFGLVSTRRERVSLEPLVTGVLTLPPVDLHWWDAGLDRGRHAALPAHQLNVQLPPLVEGEPTARLPNPAERPQDQPGLGLILLLTLTSLVSALGWLYTWARLRRLRREYRLSERQQEADRRQRKLLQTNDRAERSTFQALAIACRQNSALQARSRLIEWAQNFWPEHHIDGLEAICDAARNQTLDYLILDLEQHLHEATELWQGDLLLQSIDALRRRRPELADNSEELPLAHAS